jgi:hypothetical protein
MKHIKLYENSLSLNVINDYNNIIKILQPFIEQEISEKDKSLELTPDKDLYILQISDIGNNFVRIYWTLLNNYNGKYEENYYDYDKDFIMIQLVQNKYNL